MTALGTVGERSVRPGQLLEVVYFIENTTGATQRVLLGASILPTGLRHAWSTRGINDPRHDLVATVPPGVSLHVRFFEIPRSLSPGSYDVGWGLKTPAGGYITFIPVAHELRVVA